MTISLALIAAATVPFADLDAIDRTVEEFTGQAIGQTGGAMQPVDRRLRLRPCASRPSVAWRDARKDTVVVQCGDAGGWRLFVPVNAPERPAEAQPVIKRGDAVTIAVSGEGFTVSQPGEAMEAGKPGDWIRVRTLTASRVASEPMRARVIRPGLVGLPLP